METPEANLSRAMGQMLGAYTQDFNRRHRRSRRLFQGHYKAILVEKDAYLLALSRYIHLNPVRVGEVSRAGVWGGSARGQQGDCAHGGAEKRRGKGWTGVGAAYF